MSPSAVNYAFSEVPFSLLRLRIAPLVSGSMLQIKTTKQDLRSLSLQTTLWARSTDTATFVALGPISTAIRQLRAMTEAFAGRRVIEGLGNSDQLFATLTKATIAFGEEALG